MNIYAGSKVEVEVYRGSSEKPYRVYQDTIKTTEKDFEAELNKKFPDKNQLWYYKPIEA
jgi:hypothetical protein